MHNDIQFDASQVEVLYETQINTTKRDDIVLRTVTNRLESWRVIFTYKNPDNCNLKNLNIHIHSIIHTNLYIFTYENVRKRKH